MRLLCAAVLCLSLASFPVCAEGVASDVAMQAAVDRFASHPSLRHGSVSVCVMRLGEGDVVAGHTIDEACITASTMKTVTSATALELLGHDFTFGTQAVAIGHIDHHGTLKGDLVVRGGGDPTLGSRYFAGRGAIIDSIVASLHSHGIGRIDGRVVIDNSAIPYPPVGNCWMHDDLGYDYGAGCFGLCFADNVLQVTAGRSGSEVTDFSVTPPSMQMVIKNRIQLYDNKEDMEVSHVEAVPDYDTPALTLWGGALRSDKPLEMTFANPAPYHTFEDSLLRALHRAEIKVRNHKKEPGRDKAVPDTLLLLDFRSPALPEVLSSLLYRSDNMYTEMTLRAIAALDGKPATIKNGVARVHELWTAKGVDCTPLFMRDGSGLSRNNKASARFLCHLLRSVEADSAALGCDFAQLLPVGGVSGTLQSLLGKTPLKGRVALKSGSMSDVQCFAGYYPAENPEYAVAVLVNNFVCPRSELLSNIEKLFVELFAAE